VNGAPPRVFLLLLLAAAGCTGTHTREDAGASADGSSDGGSSALWCDLSSVLSCGACDNPCERNERCVRGRCSPDGLQVSLNNHFILARRADGVVQVLGKALPPGLTPDGATEAREWTVVRDLEGGSLPTTPYAHVCVARDGTVSCWGDNSQMQLGVASPTASFEFVEPALPPSIVHVALGPLHSCAVGSDDSVHCWGFNGHGELGIGSRTPMRSEPVRVPDRAGTVLGLGPEYSCLVDVDGQVGCWGEAAPAVLPAPLPDHARVARLAPQNTWLCVVFVDGSAACSGSLVPELRLTPGGDDRFTELAFLGSRVVDLGVGPGFHALLDGEVVVAWGSGGQMGPLVAGDEYEAPDIVGPFVVPVPPMLTLSCGGSAVCCGVTVDEQLWCWGHRSAFGGFLWPSSSAEFLVERIELD